MSFTTEELKDDSRFKLLKALKYNGIIEFVFDNIGRKNAATRLYYFVNIVLPVIIIGLSYGGFKNDLFNVREYTGVFLWGFFGGSILVIPLHELLHGLAYKILGAPKIHFGADLKQAIFFVVADKHVVGRKEFFFVAFFPFVTINIMALIIMNFLPPDQFILILFFLFFHNVMCIGDFAMASYFIEYNHKELYTYDDHKEKISYIYERIS